MKLSLELAEICGIHAGDGYLRNDGHRIELDISGNLEEKEYYREHISRLFEKVFNIKPKCRFFKSRRTYGFVIRNRKIIESFNNIGFPYGKKSAIVNVPLSIFESRDKDVFASFIRGVFDTDGSLTFDKKNKDKYHKYPRIILSTISEEFWKQLIDMLHYLGFRTYSSIYNSKIPTESTIYKIWVVGTRMLEKWMNEVGSKNTSKISRYLVWKKYGFCPPHTTFKQRRNLLKGEINPILLYKGP